ncbi:MAG TPA: hypothetical protein GX507_10205 [Clostridia bacterium]|nr:hypothetical protein [Clostridia bacterium]
MGTGIHYSRWSKAVPIGERCRRGVEPVARYLKYLDAVRNSRNTIDVDVQGYLIRAATAM